MTTTCVTVNGMLVGKTTSMIPRVTNFRRLLKEGLNMVIIKVIDTGGGGGLWGDEGRFVEPEGTNFMARRWPVQVGLASSRATQRIESQQLSITALQGHDPPH